MKISVGSHLELSYVRHRSYGNFEVRDVVEVVKVVDLTRRCYRYFKNRPVRVTVKVHGYLLNTGDFLSWNNIGLSRRRWTLNIWWPNSRYTPVYPDARLTHETALTVVVLGVDN